MSYMSVSRTYAEKNSIMATGDEIQNILNYNFTKRELLHEATLAAGAALQKDVDGKVAGNKPLALIGDALIRLDVATRAYNRGTGVCKTRELSSPKQQFTQ